MSFPMSAFAFALPLYVVAFSSARIVAVSLKLSFILEGKKDVLYKFSQPTFTAIRKSFVPVTTLPKTEVLRKILRDN